MVAPSTLFIHVEKWQMVFLQTEWSFLSQYQSTMKKKTNIPTAHTHTPVSQPFFRDYPDRPVPER